MANRFRTGMALAMFSLVVFTLVVMAFILHASASVFNDTARLSGGYDIRATVSYINPIWDIKSALSQSDTVKVDDFQAIGSFSGVRAKVKQADTAQEYEETVVQGVDKSYSDSVTYGMEMVAEGYASAQEVWSALQSQPDMAVVSPLMVPTRANYNFGGPAPDLKLEGFYLEDKALPEVYLLVQHPMTGAEQRLRVIGVVSQIAFYAGGIVTSQDSLAAMAGQPVPPATYFLKVAPGVDAAATAKALRARFLENGMQTEVLDEEIRKNAQTSLMFNNLLQGFMGLGLVVGIAALGVIAARSVVERRQQIGVVRAIGFQRSMVQASFLLESSFISLLGIGLGIALAVGLSVQIIDQMKEWFPGIRYTVPVWNIVVVAVIAYGASLLTTFLPARQAANVYPAEALRYE
ncbi:MAG: FtsX-like permease family protein [Chloroflexota bacterium]|nr:FtsX-like permease family protein [Chloroflexota bacterium]